MLRAGLIGVPSTGKTTLFQLLTRTSTSASSRKFGPTDANIAVASVPDPRLDRLTELFQPKRRVPATVVVADIVGTSRPRDLVDVAPYREADALLHVVRAFRAEEVPHPAGSIDAARDARSMEDELILADLGVAERRIERIRRDVKKGAAVNLELELRTLETCRDALERGTPIRALPFESSAAKTLRGFRFLSAKPLLLVINLDEADIQRADEAVEMTHLTEMLSHALTRAVSVCAKIELEIAQLDPVDARAFLADLGLRETGLDRVVRTTYELLGYISFFTAEKNECRAWSIPDGTVAQLAAGEIHTDMERGFIRAEVVEHDALVSRGSIAACRDYGEVRLEGKEYVVRDGDVINFRFAT